MRFILPGILNLNWSQLSSWFWCLFWIWFGFFLGFWIEFGFLNMFWFVLSDLASNFRLWIPAPHARPAERARSVWRTLPWYLLPATSARAEYAGSCMFCLNASGQLQHPGGLKPTEQGQRTLSGSRLCHLSQLTCSLDRLRPFAFITATFIQPFITMFSLVMSGNPRREAVWKSATERARRQSPACFMLTSRCHVEHGEKKKARRDKGTSFTVTERSGLHWIMTPWVKGQKKKASVGQSYLVWSVGLLFF